jgi:molecular chaperone GrpE
MNEEDTKNSTSDDVTIEADADLDDSVVAEEAAAETIKKLREKLKKALAEKQEYLTGWQKDKAEFLNARKRDEAANREMIKFSNESLIAELIPVLDSFNMAFSNKEAWEKVDKNWRTGVEYISNQLKKILDENGLKEIDPTGLKFDPMRDEAAEYEPVTDESKDHTVTTVITKGYSYHGRVIKAPKVKVGEFKKAE